MTRPYLVAALPRLALLFGLGLAGAASGQTPPAALQGLDAVPTMSPQDLLQAGSQTAVFDPATLTAKVAALATLADGGPALAADTPVQWELFTITPDRKVGNRVAHGSGADVLAVVPGDYVLSATLDRAQAAVAVTLTANTTATPTVVLNAGRVQISPELVVEGKVFNGALTLLTGPDGTTSTHVGPVDMYIGAGTLKASVTFDGIKMNQTLELAPGQTLVQRFAPEGGIAALHIDNGPAGLPADLTPRLDVFKAERRADGGLQQVAFDRLGERAFALPAGDYIAQGMLDTSYAQVPFSVRVGETVEVAIPLQTAQLQILAPGALQLRVFRLAADGSQDQIYNEWDIASLDWGVPVGDYKIDVLMPDGSLSKTVTATAGATLLIEFP